MNNLLIVKKNETDPSSNGICIQDVFGNTERTYGSYELEPTEVLEFNYDKESTAYYCLEGKITLTDMDTTETCVVEEGDFIYAPLKPGKKFTWTTEKNSKFIYRTYPHLI